MPGLVGLITRMPRERAEQELLDMLATLQHESFYVAGTYADESLGVYVGWTARKGSFSDGMPLRNERGDVVLVFSGEEFSEPDTKRRLEEKGHTVGSAPSDYLVHLYEEDSSFPAALNGRFHGLVIDRKTGTARLFNDRYGMHRVCYNESKEAFYFSAEAKAILAVRPELRRMDSRGMGEFVSCGSVLENRTLFKDIHVLPTASIWTFANGSLRQKGAYFHPQDWEEQETLDLQAYYAELRNVFAKNLPRYFGGPESVAMSLTGGLDTRMILAWQRHDAGSLPCYTFGSMFRENHDVRVARRVAAACKQQFQVITAGSEFLSQFPRYAERSIYLTEGCADTSRSPDLYLNEQARQVAPVRMTGNYGGEILRSVRAFKPQDPLPGLFQAGLVSDIRRARETYTAVIEGHPVSFAVFKQGPWHHHGILSLEQTQLSLRSPYLDNDFLRTVFRAPRSSFLDSKISLRLIADGNETLSRIPTDRGLGGQQAPVISPLSRGLLEFSFKAEYAYDMGMPQWLARTDHALASFHLERLFLGRHKPFHFRLWFRDALAPYIQDVLLDSRSLSRPYVERGKLEEIVRGHVKGNRNYTTEIHKVLTLELLHRLFIDSGANGGCGKQKRLEPSVDVAPAAGRLR